MHPSEELPDMNLILSAAGRRVVLLRLICQSRDALGIQGKVFATDIWRVSPAVQLADHGIVVPRYSETGCLDRLLEICREYSIGLVIPTIDPDLPFYAEHRGAFEAIGTQIMVSTPEVVRIGNDKQATHEWLTGKGLPTLRQADAAEVLREAGDWRFPLFAKPRLGNSSIGAMVVKDAAALTVLAREREYIVQEIAPGREYTVDVYVDRAGTCRCAVPRLRIETRGGEVVKGMTARIPAIQEVAKRVAEALPGAWGVLNIQVFYDESSGAVNVIEINPRFGGGYPLTHAAGAPMTRWLLEEATGQPCTARDDAWTDGLVMLRYDEAVFVSRDQAGV